MKLEELNLNQKRAIFERKVTVLEAKEMGRERTSKSLLAES
jgi:hypothetical protein